MILLAIAINLVGIVLLVALGASMIAGLIRPWPCPREHHTYHCASCACSYAGPGELARHHTAQHTDDLAYWPVRDPRVVGASRRRLPLEPTGGDA